MTAQIIDGRACARRLKDQLISEIDLGGHAELATLIVGNSFEADAYERRLARLAFEVGVGYRSHRLSADAALSEVLSVIEQLNDSPEVSGILVLRPLPEHIDETTLFRTVSPTKDIEAVHPENAGLLALGAPRFVPSTAAAVFYLLDTWLDSVGEDRADFYHRSLIVVVGRSNNVGKPAVSLGYHREAAVQSIDEWASKCGELGRHTRQADVLIVAAGKPGLIKAEHVSPGAVVLDVGINPYVGTDGTLGIVGDVDPDSVGPRVRALTPVPGGVGPVTDVWLLRNTVLAARFVTGFSPSQDTIAQFNSTPVLEAL